MCIRRRGTFKNHEYWDTIRQQVNQPGKGVSGCAIALGLLGRKEEACHYLDQLHRRAEDDSNIDLDSELSNGMRPWETWDKAFYYLHSCYEKRAVSIMFCLRYPLNELFNKDERYWQLLEKMKLKKYYEENRTSI